ncbi:hypothetical protein HK105_203993 [Polyrhizophydium stewartii]|uniref:Rab-GAP TBC domain-containing protein n=1 Tax=Polyrhizophydium stewartii TaxID=2732419 RepID=A0ABR4NAM3_9FUNG
MILATVAELYDEVEQHVGLERNRFREESELDALAEVFAEQIQSTSSFWIERKRLTESVLKQASTPQELERLVVKAFGDPSGFHGQVDNFTVMWHRRHVAQSMSIAPADNSGDGSGGVIEMQLRAAAISLNTLVLRRLNRMSIEMSTPLARRRSVAEEAAFMASSDNEYTAELPSSLLQNDCFPSKGWGQDMPKTCLCDDADLLEAVKAVGMRAQAAAGQLSASQTQQPKQGKQHRHGGYDKFWTCLSVSTQTTSLEEFRMRFSELHPQFKHIGLDDTLESEALTGPNPGDVFVAAHIEVAEAALASGSSRAARQLAKHGIPPSLRPRLWDLMLQSDMTEDYSVHVARTYTRLKVMASRYDLLVDRLVRLDAKHASNDDGYFVFEDMVREVLLLWTRDVWMRRVLPLDPTNALGSNNNWSIDSSPFPPSGVLPVWGIALYAMPVCFLHGSAGHAYMTFREMYARYFYNLHTVSARPGGLFHLCQTFETVLKQADAAVYYHMATTLGLEPLDLVFKWILYGFVGVLDCEQVLLLWDRVLGYDTLELLPVTAAALVVFRRDQILQADSVQLVQVCACV